jgi:hypothetical protein
MTIGIIYAALMLVTPGSSGLFGSAARVQELQRFESIEHCEHAAKMYRLYIPSPDQDNVLRWRRGVEVARG